MTSDDIKVVDALAGIEAMYTNNLDVHGAVPKSVGWKDEASQELRFDKLVQLIDTKTIHKGISVNDLGCGYGAMFHYLEKLLSGHLTKYYGYDISGEMLSAARRMVLDSRAVFIESARITNKADYSFVSGIFHVKREINNKVWTEYVKEMLMHLSSLSKRGFAFNSFSTYVDWKQDDLFYADPLVFFDFCKRNISKYVSLLHDYPLFEWTILVRVHP